MGIFLRASISLPTSYRDISYENRKFDLSLSIVSTVNHLVYFTNTSATSSLLVSSLLSLHTFRNPDPSTALAILGLALQVSTGLYRYYEIWRDCGRDVQDIRYSLLRLINIFNQIDITLQKPGLRESLVSTINAITKTCEEKVEELRFILHKVKQDGPVEGILRRLKAHGRRACYPFRSSTISRISEIIDELKDDLNIVVGILSL